MRKKSFFSPSGQQTVTVDDNNLAMWEAHTFNGTSRQPLLHVGCTAIFARDARGGYAPEQCLSGDCSGSAPLQKSIRRLPFVCSGRTRKHILRNNVSQPPARPYIHRAHNLRQPFD